MIRKLYANVIAYAVAWWANKGVLADVLYAIGHEADVLEDKTIRAVKYRFPQADTYADALSNHSNERRLRQGPSEANADFATRLETYKAQHKLRGTPRAMLTQVAAYLTDLVGPDLFLRLVDRAGNQHVWQDGTITKSTVDTSVYVYGGDANPERWARWTLYVHSDAVTLTQDQATLVPTEWNAAHCTTCRVFATLDGTEIWDEPGDVWADTGDSWGDGTSTVLYAIN